MAAIVPVSAEASPADADDARHPVSQVRRPVRLARRTIEGGFAILVLVVFAIVVASHVAPMVGRPVYIVGGPSMEPAIPLGSAVVLEPVGPADLAVGDVVTLQVRPDAAAVTHRIIRVIHRADGRWIHTQGDANEDPDPVIVPASAVIGRVDWVLPGFGYALAALGASAGLAAVGGAAGFMLAGGALLETFERRRSPTLPA